MDRGPHPDYARWVVTHGDPRPSTQLARPRPALVRVELYDGSRTVLELDVVARAAGFVCVRQPLPGRAPWFAWVPVERAQPLAAGAVRGGPGGARTHDRRIMSPLL